MNLKERRMKSIDDCMLLVMEAVALMDIDRSNYEKTLKCSECEHPYPKHYQSCVRYMPRGVEAKHMYRAFGGSLMISTVKVARLSDEEEARVARMMSGRKRREISILADLDMIE